MGTDLLLMTALAAAIFSEQSFCKPTEVVTNPDTLDPVRSTINHSLETDAKREQRSPQFGLLGNYGDYSDYDDNSRNFRLGRKFHKPHHKPFGLFGGHGCRGLGCGGGWQPGHNGHHHAGQGGSFATASAGSVGEGGGPYGGHSEANAQSASFSLGPYSATFSVAHASSGREGF